MKKIRNVIVISGWALCILAVVSTVFVVLYLQMTYPLQELPSTVKEWGGIAFGFIFGSVFSMLRDYMNEPQPTIAETSTDA